MSSNSRVLRPPQALAMLLAFLLASAMGGFLLAGLAVPLAAGAGTVTNAASGVFSDLPEELKIDPPSEITSILAADGSLLAYFYNQNRIVVSLDEISPNIRNAIIAIEDRRFWEHSGVDVAGMARALFNNATGGSTEGASTLTQQYVKNVLMEEARAIEGTDPVRAQELYDAATQQTYGRKLQEARYAIALEQQYTKDEILAGYLNISQFGPSVFGVEAASRHYFGHSANELSVSEAALLAGIPQAPNKWDPLTNPAEATNRRDTVLMVMLQLGYIDQAQHDEAVAIPVEQLVANAQSMPPVGCASAGISAYFCEYVVKDFLNTDAFGGTRADRMDLLMRGGLTITTTLDPARQQYAHDAVVSSVPINDASGIAMALSAVEPGTGRIGAMAQNTNYGREPTPEDPSMTAVNYNVGQEHGGGVGFQTGSTFKAIVLTQWLRMGNSLMENVPGNTDYYGRNEWTISCAPDNAAVYTPSNLEGSGSDRVSVLEATRKSINLPFVWMATQMDLCGLADLAGDMGLKRGDGSALEINPAMVLGSNTITPLDMAAAFATYANNGVYCSPVAITEIKDRDGNALQVPATTCNQVLDPNVNAGVNYALQKVVAQGGTASRAVLAGGRPAAGKTGTANRDWHAWFVGYTPQLSAAVWMGHADAYISMFGSRIDGRYYAQVYGGILPAPTWKAFMDPALAGEPNLGFPDVTNDNVIYGDLIPVPSVIGLTPADATQRLESAGFSVRVQSGSVYSGSISAGNIASQSPGGGGLALPGSVISITASAGPEPAPPVEDPGLSGDGSGGDQGNSGNQDSNGQGNG